MKSKTSRAPIEGPLVRLWHLPLLFLLIPLGAVLGDVGGNPEFSFAMRAAAGLAAWLIPLVWLLLLVPWVNRLDEFQQKIVWQGAGTAGFAALSYVVAMGFYSTLTGNGLPLLVLIGSTPGMGALTAALMVMGLERRARRKTAGARE